MDVVLHGATLLALLALFWRDFYKIIAGVPGWGKPWHRDPDADRGRLFGSRDAAHSGGWFSRPPVCARDGLQELDFSSGQLDCFWFFTGACGLGWGLGSS